MIEKNVLIRGKKVASRPSWAYAALAGLITFLVIAFLSTGATGGADSKEYNNHKSFAVKPEVEESLSPERGYRGYAVKIGIDDGTLECVSSGDKIDVIVSFPAGPDGTPATKTVISGARLLRYSAGKRLAVVEVTPTEAEKLAFSEANGQVRLSVCPPGPDASMPGQGATFEDI
jgi:hypothetical protein